MKKTRILISNVLKDQLPSFVREDYPLIEELFSEYYKGLEYQGGVLDILQNVDQYIKLNNLTNLIDKTELTEDLNVFSTEISVKSTAGFPDRYGLIQIGSEIILYKSKTLNSFNECVRGFSGIASYEGQLDFEETNSAEHLKTSAVKNLNILFLNQFLTKVKKQFAPGFENRKFFSKTDENNKTIKLNENIFIKQLRDFYSSKGTDVSFKILFKALFDNDVEVIKPRDFLIRPSDAQYRINKELVIESFQGDPLDLVDTTIYQNPLTIDGKDFISYAYGTVNKVRTISRKDKTYYVVSLDYDYNKDINLKGSVYGEFVIGPKTLITDSILQGSTAITVDSTYGFPEKNGILRIPFSDGTKIIVTYQKKNLNQFLGCKGITREVSQGQEVYLNYYCEGGNTVGNDQNPIKFRITGVLSEATTTSDSHYIVPGNKINLRTLGKDIQTTEFNNWKFNIAPSYKIKNIVKNNALNNTYSVTLYDDHIFYAGDSAKLISSRPQLIPGAELVGSSEFPATILSVDGKYSFTCAVNFDLDTSLTYEVERKINKFNFSYNSSESEYNNTYITDIQNVYKDSDGSLYVAAQSLPTYVSENEILPIDDDTVVLSTNVYISEEINANNSQITDKILNIGPHTFKTGDAVYYQSGSGTNSLNIAEGIYYVKVVGPVNASTQIKLANSRTNIDNNLFLNLALNQVRLEGSENKLFTSTNEIIYFQNSTKNSLSNAKFQRVISPKNLIRKLNKPIETKDKVLTSPGQIGILINGVEILNYKSNEYVYYGPIKDIKIKSSGNNYDIITPPKLAITDKNGSGAEAVCHITGSLTKIEVLDGGFDYQNVPKIEISGGNGSNAEATANMTSFEYSVSFNGSKDTQIKLKTETSPNTITFNKKYKFYDGEAVKYTCSQIPIGGLNPDTVYYVSSIDNYSLKLYGRYEDAISKLNPINLTEYAPGVHFLTSVEKKNTIGSINVVNSGKGYSNRKTIIPSENINVFSNIIKIPNHGYQTGETIVYSTTGSPIVGLSTTLKYLVYKVNDNEFKLCQINTATEDKNFYLKTEQFINFTGPGTGNHIFNYPPISVKILGAFKNKKLDVSEIEAKIIPSFRGPISSVFLVNGGSNYGSQDILNFNRQPDFRLENGSGAELRPIISNGKISEVLIVNGGTEYTAIPEIEVVGSGTGAKLLPIIVDGRITDVKIVSAGINYNPNTTILNVVSAGFNANFEFLIQTWNVNSVERSIQSRNTLTNDIFLNDTKNEYNERITQITHSYAPRKLRENLVVSREDGGKIYYKKDLTFDNSNIENTTSNIHSPIIGWAYDGNPIYGPFGYENVDGTGLVKKMKSGYTLNANKTNRPSQTLFSRGFFVEDYDFVDNGDLDEYNGRFCVTPEFPNGVYAYFATFGDIDRNFSNKYSRPIFPYLIGNYYKSSPIDFNFDFNQSQNFINFENLNFLRNTTPYKLLSKTSTYNYAFNPIKYEDQLNKISRVGNGKIDKINVISGGENYKVGDRIILSKDEFGNKSYAQVSRIKGPTVSSVSVDYYEIPSVEFGSGKNLSTIVGVASTPHQLKDQDIINVIGLNNILTNDEKNVSCRINVFKNRLILTKDVQPSNITGIITTFEVLGNLNDEVIRPNDVYIANGEEVQILNINRTKSSLRVKRTVGTGTTLIKGDTLTEKPRKFEISTIDTPNSIDFDNILYPLNREIYFNPADSVGLGTVGITSSILLKINKLNYQVAIDTGAKVANTLQPKTGLVFRNQSNSPQFRIGDHIDLTGSTDIDFDQIKKSKVLNVGITSITVDFDSSSLVGTGVTSFVTKWETREIPTRSIYLPNHNLNTGDKVRYFSNSGSGLGISTDKITINTLNDNDLLYVYKFDDDHIGIGRTVVGLTPSGEYLNPKTGESLLYFVSSGSGLYHSFKTEYDVQVGNIIKNIARISTLKDPSLFFNENVNVSLKSNNSRTIVIKYNKENRRLVANPKSFTEADVDVTGHSIKILDHGYSTGDKVVYTTEDPLSQLDNNQIYYIVVVDNNNIKLSTTYYNAKMKNPIVINISVLFAGTFSLINPAIKLYRNEIVKFDLTDKSLSFTNNEILYSAFKFNIYKDPNFTEKFVKSENDTSFTVKKTGTIGITNNAAVEIKISDFTPPKLFYRFELDNINYSIPNEQLEYIIDTENINYNNTLFIKNSVYSGDHKVYKFGNNFFEYTLREKPEKDVYYPSTANISYNTDSYSTLGEIVEVDVLSKDRKYRTLPGITSISSKTGSGSILFPYSQNIGSAKKVKIEEIGFDYSSDYSLRPTGNLPQIIQVEPLSIFKEIKVTSIGKNYTTTPSLIVLDGLTKIQDKQVELKFVPEDSMVEIIQNSSGLYNKTPYIIPINNSNGITVRAGSASFTPISKTLRLVFTTLFNSEADFPFKVGDKVLLENFRVSSVFINENGELQTAANIRGINSENYGYALFEVLEASSSVGGFGASIVIDMSPYLKDDEVPGKYEPFNSLGYVVPEKYFPTFDITLQKNNFVIGEEVTTSSGYTGIVEYWDRDNEFVSVLGNDKFITGDKITGKTSNLTGVVGRVEFFGAEYSTNSYSVVERGWDTDTGFLNDNIQRIHDSNYYQYFSYALKSKTQFSEWNDAVSSLNHTVGFKKFGTLEIESLTPSAGIVTVSYSELNSVSDFFEVIDLNSYQDFDMVSENSFLLGNRIVSDQVVFNTREIQDYSESIGNRVLMIDDFSDKFNNLPRTERYSIADRFPIYQNRHRKYFAYVKDKLFFNERQLSVISLIHDNVNGFVNQYGRLETVDELGAFEFVINGDEGQLQFKPYAYEYNDFDIDLVSYSLFDTFVGLGSTSTTSYPIGAIANLSNEVSVLPINSTDPVRIAEIPATYRSSKIILTVDSKDGTYRESTELNLIHDNSQVYVSEYGKLFTKAINPSVGLATYNAYLDGSNLVVDIVPYVGYGSTVEINVFKLAVFDSSTTVSGVYAENNIRLESGYVNIPSGSVGIAYSFHNYSLQYGGGYYYISIENPDLSVYQSLELLTLNNLNDVYHTQFGSVITNDSLVGFGTFATQIIGNRVYVSFIPSSNNNFDIRFYYNGIKTINEQDIPPSQVIVDLNQAQIVSFNSDYIGTQNSIKRSFDLYHKKVPIMRRSFRGSSSASVDLINDKINIPNHYFTTGEEVTYDYGGDEPIGIAATIVAGIGLTDKLPSKLYIIKKNDLSIRVAASASQALKANPEYLDLNSYGLGSQHTFTGKRGNSRSLITLDNMIQSPIVSTSEFTKLSSDLALKDVRVKVENPSVFIGGDIFKVDDEIIRVKIVGFGSTNTLLVSRYWMGSYPGIHSTGAVCTKLQGGYNIVNNTIHFYDPPYGKVPVVPDNPKYDEVDFTGITTHSTFSGRIFNKSGSTNNNSATYSDNILLDDISGEFNGISTTFILKENGIPVTGISTSNLFVLVKDILQIPLNQQENNNGAFKLGQNLSGKTTIVFNKNQNQDLSNIDDINTTNIPSGGIILSVGSTFGGGYQPIKKASGYAEVNDFGLISNISIGFTGSGYRLSGSNEILVSTASTVSIGTNIIPINEERGLFAKLAYSNNSIANIGIGTSLHSVLINDYNPLLSTITISRSTDVIIPQDTYISVNLNSFTTEIVDIEVRSESSNDYQNYYIGFTTVIAGSISTSLNLINPGIAFTSLYDKFITKSTIDVSSGSNIFYLNTINGISEGDYISINSSPGLKIIGIGNTFVQTATSFGSAVVANTDVLVRRYSPPEVIFDNPVGYSNIPLIYSSSSGSSGIGTGAEIKITVGENGTVIDFDIQKSGYGYKKYDILTVPVGGLSGIPTDTSTQLKEFKIFVDSVYNSKFSSWSIGDLQVIDNFDSLFDGNRKVFPIKIDGQARSIRAKKGSTLDIQASLIVLFNDILQVPGDGYIFKGGSIIYFPESPKFGDRVSIIFYRGNQEVDVVDVNVLETVKVGDGLKIVSNDKKLIENERIIADVVSSDYANTNPYSGKGISGDFNLLRPVTWSKQNVDFVIDGTLIGKDRTYYEPNIYPSANIIQDIKIDSNRIYVESLKTFFDNDAENIIDKDKFIIKIIDQSPIRGAIATCRVSSAGTVFAIDVIDGGYGYEESPIVTIQNSSNSVGISYTMSLTSIVNSSGFSTSTLENAVLGEYLVGTQSNSSAILSGFSTQNTTISYIPSNPVNFIQNEEVRFETSGLSAKIVSISNSNSAIGIANINGGVVTSIDLSNIGYGYTYGPISQLKVISAGSGYPETLNPSNNVFYNARLKSRTGNGTNGAVNITLEKDLLSIVTRYVAKTENIEIIQGGTEYSIGDILEVDTFDNVGVGLTNRNKVLTSPILFEVTEIQPPIVIIEEPKPKVEVIDSVTFKGDFGSIVGVAGSFVSAENENIYDCLILDFYIPENSYLRNNVVIGNTVVGSAITVSQLTRDDYFIISNSNIGNEVQSLSNKFNILATSYEHINNVYQVFTNQILKKYIVGIGTVYVNSITTLINYPVPGLGNPSADNPYYGNYSWGRIEGLSNRKDPKQFLINPDTNPGVGSNPIVQRFNSLKYVGYSTVL